MHNIRALLLSLALEATEPGRLKTRFRRPKTAFVATLLMDLRCVKLVGFLESGGGFELLWQQGGCVRLART
jgi:hypothetical protein